MSVGAIRLPASRAAPPPELPPPPENPPELELHDALLELPPPIENPPTVARPLVFRSRFAFSYHVECTKANFASGKAMR